MPILLSQLHMYTMVGLHTYQSLAATDTCQLSTMTPLHHVKDLVHFSNTRAVLSCVQGGFFLRKKPLGILLSLYTNWKNALVLLNPNRRKFLEASFLSFRV
jgi:hypothetical protein